MPITLSRGDRRLLLSGTAVFAVLVVLGALLSTGKSADDPTSYSDASAGAKAAYLLLQASGYRVDRFEQPVQDLPDAASTTLILAEPIESPNAADRKAVARFIERGGRVIATGDIGGSFLEATVKTDPIAGLTWKTVSAVSPSAITRAAPVITLSPETSWGLLTFAVPLYADADANAYVVRIPSGAGEAIWWGSATPLTNAGITAPGNLEFVLACLGPPGPRRVLFDEYVHGHRHTLAGSMWHSPVRWVMLQLALLALVLVATHSRRSGPTLLPAVESRLSPLEFVRTLGSLYARAGVASVAVEMAYQRVRQALTRRLGIAPHASTDDVARALTGRAGVDAPALVATLTAADDARNRRALDPRSALALVRSLSDIVKVLNKERH